MDTDAITLSLELAGEACPDLSPVVYARLFAQHPEMEAMFIRDTNGAIRGEMLARVFELILDFIDRRSYSAHMIQCEVVTHDGYGVPPDVFAIFFGTVRDGLKQVLAAGWTEAMETAWSELLEQLDFYVKHPDQSAAA